MRENKKKIKRIRSSRSRSRVDDRGRGGGGEGRIENIFMGKREVEKEKK